MTRTRTSTLFLGAFCAAALLAAANVARADDAPVTLAYHVKKGDVAYHKATVTASIMGADVLVTTSTKSTVKDVKDNGDFVVEQTNLGTHVSFGGQEQDQDASAPVTVTRDKRGRLVDYKTDEAAQAFVAPEVQRLIAMLNEVLLPEKPVKQGDSWETVLDNPAAKGKKVTVKDTYLGTEKVNGVDAWKVHQTAEAVVDADGNKMSVDSTIYMNPATGQAMKGEAVAKDVPTLQAGPITMNVKLEETKAPEEKKP